MTYTYYSTNSSGKKSSHIKVPSQVSLIDCLVFNLQETISVLDTQRKNDSLTMKFTKNHHMGTFKKYVRSRFPSFDHLPPLFALARFRASPPPKGTFVSTRTHPLPFNLNFYTSEIQRKEINNEY